MSDFVNRLLGLGDAAAPPIRPLIGSLFEPRRRMHTWVPQDEPPRLPAELERPVRDVPEQVLPADERELPAEPSDLAPPPAGPAGSRTPDGAPEPPQAVGAEPPAAPARPAEPAAFALPKPRRSDVTAPEEPPEVAEQHAMPAEPPEVPEQHATPAEPPLPDTPAALAPDPVRAHPVPASLIDPLLTSRRERATAPPDVRITIGRVEVRANRQPPTPQPPRRIPGRRPAMSLEDYLRTRSEGGGAR